MLLSIISPLLDFAVSIYFLVLPIACSMIKSVNFNRRSLNSNNFNGQIPPAIGNLSNLYWLDLADNQLEGPIPISNGTAPGLDMLHLTKHLYVKSNL